jgi:hypothetical protein
MVKRQRGDPLPQRREAWPQLPSQISRTVSPVLVAATASPGSPAIRPAPQVDGRRRGHGREWLFVSHVALIGCRVGIDRPDGFRFDALLVTLIAAVFSTV